MSSEENHRRFLRHLRESEWVRWYVAQWLSQSGYSVSLAPVRYAPTTADWQKFADQGDLHINMRIEVKGLSRHFTCREDWPFGVNFIVCARHSYDNADPKPYAYIILNNTCTHAAFVLSASYATWRVERRVDSRYDGIAQEYYLAPLDAVTFAPLG